MAGCPIKMNCIEKLTVLNETTGEKIIIRVKPETAAKAKSDSEFMRQLTRQVLQERNAHSSKTIQVVPLILTENSEEFTLHVSPSDYNRAMTDVWFASELLQNYKNTVSKQASNSLGTDTSMDEDPNMDEEKSMSMQIFDEETKRLYTLQVSRSEYARTIHDSGFARYLLATHKQNLNKGRTLEAAVNGPLPNSVTGNDSDDLDDSQNESIPELQKEKGKTPRRWNEEQTLLLLSLYKENNSKLDDGLITHRKFWNTIVEGLKVRGHIMTIVQCTAKMDSLKRAYKKVKDHNACSGNSKKTCDHYEILDELFYKKPWIKPLSIAGSNIPMVDMGECDGNPQKKRRKMSDTMDRTEYMRQSLEIQRLRSERTAQYREEKLQLLEKLTQKFLNNT